MERHGSSSAVGQPPENLNYSTLEVADPQLQTVEHLRQGSAQFIDRTTNEEKVFVARAPAAVNGEEFYEGLQVVGNGRRREGRICGLRRRTFLIAVGMFAVAVVVGVAVGVTAMMKSRSAKATSLNDGTPAQDQSGPRNSTTNPEAAGLPENSGLAMISWQQNGVTFRRTFYQHGTTNAIMQSTWDSNSNSSRSNIVTNSSVAVKKGTPITATVLSYNNFFDTHLAFVDPQNRMSGAFSNDPTGERWNFDRQLVSEALDVHPSSSIASLWHTCTGCVDNWVVMYQNNAGELRVRNGTNQGTARYRLEISPPLGSKLSLVQCGKSSTMMMFYTQDETDSASLFNYRWLISSSMSHGWSNASATGLPLTTIPLGSPIAPFASTNCSSFGVLFTPADVGSSSGVGKVTCSGDQCQSQAMLSAAAQPALAGNLVVNRSTIAVGADTVTAFIRRDSKTVKVLSWSEIQSPTWVFNGEQDTDGL